MVVRVRDLLDEGITVQVHCSGCGRTLLYRGQGLLYLGQRHERLQDIQMRLRCSQCRAHGELILTLPQTMIDDVRRTRNPTNPMARIGPPLWRYRD